jgi:prolyl oligopeptidase
MTDSGYPRIVKLWRRGTPLDQAAVVFEGEKTDVSSSPLVSDEPGFHREFIERGITFFTSEKYVVDGGGWSGSTCRPTPIRHLPRPADRDAAHRLDRGGQDLPVGRAARDRLGQVPRGRARLRRPLSVPAPASRSRRPARRASHLIVNELDNVRNRLYVLTPQADGTWSRVPLPAPEFGTVSAEASSPSPTTTS